MVYFHGVLCGYPAVRGVGGILWRGRFVFLHNYLCTSPQEVTILDNFNFCTKGNKLIVVNTPVVIFLFHLDADFLSHFDINLATAIFYDSGIVPATRKIQSLAWPASKISRSQPDALEIHPSGS